MFGFTTYIGCLPFSNANYAIYCQKYLKPKIPSKYTENNPKYLFIDRRPTILGAIFHGRPIFLIDYSSSRNKKVKELVLYEE